MFLSSQSLRRDFALFNSQQRLKRIRVRPDEVWDHERKQSLIALLQPVPKKISHACLISFCKIDA